MKFDSFSKGAPWRLFAIFAVLVLALVSVLSRDLRPTPLFSDDRSREMLACPVSKPLVVLIRLPGKPVSSIEFTAVIPPGARLTVSAWNADTRTRLASETWLLGGCLSLPLPSSADGVKVVVLRFESNAASEGAAPKIPRAFADPNWHAIAAPPNEGLPLLVFHFRWRSLWLLWAWVLVPFAGWMAWRRPQTVGVYLLLLALCCTLASLLVWQQGYTRYFVNWDADDYGVAARKLAEYVTHPQAREEVTIFLGRYSHSSNLLCSAIMAAPIALGAPGELVYLVFSSLCGFGSLLIFATILQRFLKVRYEAWIGAITLFAVHWLHIRSFSRPIPDEFGLLIVLAMLYLILKRLEGTTRLETLACSAMFLIIPLSRPPGLAYLPFFLGALLACDAWREKQWAPARRFATAARLTFVPMAVLAMMFLGFDWLYNCRLQLKANTWFNARHQWVYFAPIAGAVQWLPLIALCAPRESWKRPASIVLCAWAAWYVAMLFTVRANPMMSRYQLPLLPVYVALVACALETPRLWLRCTAWGLTLAACAVNIAAIFYQILVPRVPDSLIYYITSW